MRPTSHLAGLTALAFAVWLGSWFLLREPDRVGTHDRSEASGSPSPSDERAGVLVVDSPAAPSVVETSDRALAVGKTDVDLPAGGFERRELVHLHGLVSGIPSNAVRFVVQPDSDDAWEVLERRIATFLTNDRASSARSSDSSTQVSVPPAQWVGTPLAMDESDHTEKTFIEADGSYSLPDLHTGKWELVVNVASCQPLRMDVDLRPDEPERRIDIRLEAKRSLQLHLIAHPATGGIPDVPFARDGWRTIAAVSVVTSREHPGKVVESSSLGKTLPIDMYLMVPHQDDSADNASIAPDGEQKRTLVLDDPLPLHVSVAMHGVVLDTKIADVDTQELTFEIDGNRLIDISGSVRLRVVDAETGVLPTDCTVELNGQLTPSGFHLTRETSSAVPGPRGDVVFPKVTAGSVTLLIRADGYENIARSVQVLPGDTDLGTFKLDRWCEILGRTLDAEKHPASVILHVFPLDQFESTRVELSKRCFKSNEDGELKIPSIGRGRYLVRVRDETWGAAPLVVDTTGGTVRGVEITLKPKVEVALRFDRTLPSGALIRLTDGAGLPVLESEKTAGQLQRIRVLPGLYTLRVTRDREDILESALSVDARTTEVAIPSGR